jgi:hypothetical protein
MGEGEVGGATFRVTIVPGEGGPRTRRKQVASTRLNTLGKIHKQQVELPGGLLSYLKGVGAIGDKFEVRIEAVIGGTHYKTHPNY